MHEMSQNSDDIDNVICKILSSAMFNIYNCLFTHPLNGSVYLHTHHAGQTVHFLDYHCYETEHNENYNSSIKICIYVLQNNCNVSQYVNIMFIDIQLYLKFMF